MAAEEVMWEESVPLDGGATVPYMSAPTSDAATARSNHLPRWWNW